jgi:hypothetical protein
VGEVVSLTHRPPLPPGMFLVLIFTRGWDDPRAMLRSEGNMSLKDPVTPPEIDPGTVRLVAQRLNHYATPGPNCTYLKLHTAYEMLYAWCLSLSLVEQHNSCLHSYYNGRHSLEAQWAWSSPYLSFLCFLSRTSLSPILHYSFAETKIWLCTYFRTRHLLHFPRTA